MHLQVRCRTKASPPDAEKVLGLVAGAGFSLIGVGGSNVEWDGELALVPEHDDVDEIVKLLAKYGARKVDAEDEDSGLTLCIAEHKAGGLHGCLAKAAETNLARGRIIRDITVVVPTEDQLKERKVPVQIYSEEVRTAANR